MTDRDEQLDRLIRTYERLAASQDAQANHVEAKAAELDMGDGARSIIDRLRHEAETSRYLAQEVRASL